MTLVQKYVKLVDADFLEHIGQNGMPAPISKGLRDGTTKALSKKQTERLSTAIREEIKKLESLRDEELLAYVNTGDTGERMKLVLEAGEILEIAGIKNFADIMSRVCDITFSHSEGESKASEGTSDEKENKDPNDDPGHQSGGNENIPKGTPTETDENHPNDGIRHRSEGGGDTPKDTDNDGDDLGSDYGSVYANGSRGRERSAPPMREEDKEKLQKILKTHCEKAITSLKKYLSGDQRSEEPLKAMNERIQGEIAKSLGWEPKLAQNFGIPYEKFKEGVDPMVVRPLKSPCSKEDAEAFEEKLGLAKVNIYHLCLQNHLQMEWLNGLLEGAANDQKFSQRHMYNDINTDVTTYWPYNFLRTPEFDILYEKKKQVSEEHTRSSYGVQVYDAEKGVFQIQTKANIGNDNLQIWRGLPNAYKFKAADRQCKTSELGHIEHIYFFTTTRPRSGRHDSKTPAPSDVCVKFQNSILPKMLQRSKVDACLPEGESVDDIIECYEIQGKVSTWEVDEAYIDYTHGSVLIERSNKAINDRT
ncbi:hypothetical protein BJX99DRAFT_257414 [Aspergillus californicus]